MASDSFHLFSSLPYELRRMIYILASPPRFVHVQEAHEDREAFIERFRTTPVQVKLHPSIAYFAHNWRERIPRRRTSWRQATLDAYGFSGGPGARHQPWKSTSDVPGIPHHFLTDNPRFAWEFLRAGYFYSTAPIPALLHATRESRYALIDSGYELAFRTRTCGPRTWFNFKIDVLYIEQIPGDSPEDENHDLLCGNYYWDIGQFEPVDLKRVKRLALADGGESASCTSQTGTQDISSILALFTGVEELFLEEYGLRRWACKFSCELNPHDTALWTYTPVLEVDVLSSLFDREQMVSSTGYYRQGLKAYKEGNSGDGTRFFIDTAAKFEESLRSRRDELVSRDSLTPWKIPKVSIVYIDYPWMCRGLFDWRWDVWNRFQDRKEASCRAKAIEEARRSIDVPSRLVYDKDEDLPPSPFSEEFRDDLEVLEEITLAALYGEFDDGQIEEHNELRVWLSRWTVSAPDAGLESLSERG